MLTVWGRKTSSNVQALMWCIGELGLAHQRIDIGHRFGGNDSEEYLALNPNGTVPVLQDDDNAPLWETGSILRYLANAYGGEEFWPRELLAQANVDRWAEWAKLNVALKFTVPIFWRVVRTPPDKRDPVAIKRATDGLEHFLRIANSQLMKHSFLVGDNLTLADIQFGHILFRYYDIDIVRSELPAVHHYFLNLKSRPAFQQHIMVSYEELRVV